MPFESESEQGSVFDTGPAATIASGMKIHAKLGRVVIADGHLGLLRENGDLIDSAPLSEVTLKKGLTYALVPTLQLICGQTSYKVNLSYQNSINAGIDDSTAKAQQRRENAAFAELVRSLGGTAKGL